MSLSSKSKMCRCTLCGILFTIFVCCVQRVFAYNVDTVNFVEHRGEVDSMFGFAVSVHKEQGKSWVLVGAPEGQSRVQPVRKGGVVYMCETDNDNRCQEVPFDRNGNNVNTERNEIDMKDFQWFGATLSSAGENGPVVACAPRYVSLTRQRNRRDPVGTCYVARDNFGSYSEYSPCRTARWGYHRQGSCQAGLGAAISKDGRRLFIGAPGSWYWQGQTYSIDANARFPFTPGLYGDKPYGAGQVIQQSLENRPSVISTQEGPPWDDDSYMGYSMTAGFFTGDKYQGVAVGMPRGAQLFGKVLLFGWNLTNHQNITGQQLGAYFGYSLATVDVDADGLDDLIIGAPLHTQPNNEKKYEVGRVYVMYQGSGIDGRFRHMHTIDGFNSKSRFGLSLAALGDINGDGYGDFAVGAPYDGKNENGAVYIYHGSSKGVREKYSQVIYAEDVSRFSSRPMSTFGFSISGGMDLDGNDYPDMVVGAYQSNAAFFFRSRAVVVVDAVARFLTENKEVYLDRLNCLNNTVYCTDVQFCVKFRGKNIPDTLDLLLSYELDAKKPKHKRLYFLPQDTTSLNASVRLRKGDGPTCTVKKVYIKKEIRDKLTPLEVEVKYFLADDNEAFVAYNRRDPRAVLRPVLDQNTPTHVKDSISIHKNCGNDNVCTPDLQLNVTSDVTRFLLGSNGTLQLDVTILNKGEDAFESTFDIKLPSTVNYIKITEERTQVKISCSPAPNNSYHCEIGNPLPAGGIAHFKMHLEPLNVEGMAPTYDFDMWVNSTNPDDEETRENNKQHLSIGIWIDAKLQLRGSSIPPDIHYNVSSYTSKEIRFDREIGPLVTHVYSVINEGPAAISETEVFIIWPYALFNDEDLLYLLVQPNSSGDVNVVCEAVPANYKNYLIDFKALKTDIARESGKSAVAFTGSGVIIEEGAGIKGSVGSNSSYNSGEKTDVRFNSAGDSSFVFQERHKANQGGSTQGQKVVVTSHGSKTVSQGGGSGGSGGGYTRTEHVSWSTGGGSGDGNYYGSGRRVENRYGSSGGSQSSGARTEGTYYGSGASSGGVASGSRSESHYGSSGSGAKTEETYYGSGTSSGGVASGSRTETHPGSSGGGGARTEESYYGSGASSGGVASGSRTETHRSSSGGGGGARTEESYYGGGSGGSRVETHYGSNQGTYYGSGSSHQGASQSGGGTIRTQQVYPGETSGTRTESHYGYGRTGTSTVQTPPASGAVAGDEIPIVEGSYGRRVHGQNGTQFSWSSQGHSSGSYGGSYGGTYSGEQGGSNYNYQDEYESGSRTAQTGGATQSGGRRVEAGYRQEHGGTYSTEDGGYGDYDYHSEVNRRKQFQNRTSQSVGDVGNAAFGHGFRTTTLDLGSLGIEEGVSGTSHVVGNGLYDPDERRRGQGYSTSYESRREEHWSSGGEDGGRDNVPTDRPDPYSRRRVGRQADINDSDFIIQNTKQCKAAKCRSMRCTLGPMQKGEEAVIELKFRVNIKTLRNITTSEAIELSSLMLARINRLKFIGMPPTRPLANKEILTTVMAPERDHKSDDVVALWVVVLSAVAGTLILLLLIFLLYKCGFFKRNRHSDAPERQPLNRNGYHHGDEAL